MNGGMLHSAVAAPRIAGRAAASRWAWILAILLAVAAGGSAEAQEAYRLGPLDKLRIRVWEWRPASGDTFEWTPLNGEFSLDASGMISLPLVGSIHASGATTGEVAATISDRLKTIAGLIRAPTAAVEISQFRPFYIIGAVEKPGEYPFRPGVTVLQAVGIAGGFYRPDMSLTRLERDSIVSRGDIRSSEAQRIALIIRRDRLTSEAQEAASVAFSEEVLQRRAEPLVVQGMRAEVLIFETRARALQSQVELLAQANALAEEELKTLAAKRETQSKQYELARRDLENVNSLMARGLALSGRQFAAEQTVAQLESSILDLTLAAARTRQDISRNQRAAAELRTQRSNEVLKELRDTQITLDQLAERIATFEGLLHESMVLAPGEQRLRIDEAERVRFQITRRTGDKFEEIAVESTALVQPGDTIRIQRVAPTRQSSRAGAEPAPLPQAER